MSANTKLIKTAEFLSLIASLMHIAIIFGGPDWYRFFGAGEEMAQMAEQNMLYPALITFFIAGVLFIFALFAFSAAGLIFRMPLLKTALVVISAIYLVRGIFGFVAVQLIDHPYLNELKMNPEFMLISSAVSLAFGLTYAIGTAKIWPSLTRHKS